ncbi:MAG: hypothetical protein RXR32_00075 [Candidatus Micrarchaeota archaeon]
MPYIKKEERQELDKLLQPLIDFLKTKGTEEVDGQINYAFTRVLASLYQPRYFNYNRAIGVLECIKQEFYRRVVAPYEDKKKEENGDVY